MIADNPGPPQSAGDFDAILGVSVYKETDVSFVKVYPLPTK